MANPSTCASGLTSTVNVSDCSGDSSGYRERDERLNRPERNH